MEPLKIFLKGNNEYDCKKSGKSLKEKKNIGSRKKRRKKGKKEENPKTLIMSWNIFKNISLILYLRAISICEEKRLLLKWLNFLIKETDFNN